MRMVTRYTAFAISECDSLVFADERTMVGEIGTHAHINMLDGVSEYIISEIL